jgi:putative ABC transport system permease protein
MNSMRQIRLIRNVHLGIKTLMLHKLRSLLTMLGVVFGVGSVIAMLAIGEGSKEEALEQIRKLGQHNLILTSKKPAAEENVSSQGRSFMSIYGLLYDDEERIRTTIPGVIRTAPARTIPKDARLGSRQQELRVVGTTPQWFDLVRRPMVAGRPLIARDLAESDNVCVLTEQAARKMLATEHTIGQEIIIGGNVFRIVGIVHSEAGAGGTIQTPDKDVDAYIPINVSRQRFGEVITRRATGSFQRELVELHMILVEVAGDAFVAPAATAINTMLQRFHSKVDYEMDVPLALLRQAEAEKRIWNLVLGSIAGISLLVGGIGIMNIMLASVTERTREIGIRRAIGAKQRQIIGQFLIETVVLSTTGGIIGIMFGIGIPWLVELITDMRTIVPLYSVILSLGISVAVGIIFGIYPAMRAAKLDPIVALRHE